MKTWWKRLLPLMLVAVVALLVACGDDSEDETTESAAAPTTAADTAAADTAAADTGGGGGTGDVKVVSDLPLQGASGAQSKTLTQAMELYLEQQGGKAGASRHRAEAYDDSTAAKGGWDDATCAKNANDHVANAAEVAVMGTYNSGCAKIEIPVLNQDPTGPMLMVSHANTNPGLTKAGIRASPTSTTRPVCATTAASSRPTTSRVRPARSSPSRT